MTKRYNNVGAKAVHFSFIVQTCNGLQLQIHNHWIFISGAQVVSGSKKLPG